MKNTTVIESVRALKNKKISALELAQEYLSQIKTQNPKLNAVVTLNEECTLAEAKAADKALAQGNAPDLTGVPIIYKDLFCQKGWRSACASKMLDSFVSPYTATVVENLQNVGMVTLGRANMDEFAMGSTNESSFYGTVSNPWQLDAIAGGSSGGSAAVVAARLAPAALGSDTGGSIRQPASYCGITGIKPTYGMVSRFGMVAYASSLDQAGPMAQTAEDCALLLNSMVGFDQKDSTSLERAKEDYTQGLNQPIKGLTVGLPKEYFSDGLDAEVAKAIEDVVAQLQAQGANIVQISLPHTELSIASYYVIASAEASTNLSRFDGVRYGYRTPQYDDLTDMYEKSRSEGFGAEVKRRIMIGTYVLSHGYYDAYYVKAQQLRRLIANDFQEAFKKCDVILGPVTPSAAYLQGSVQDDPVKMYLGDIYTTPVNLAGLPAMSLPAGFNSKGLPIGAQLIGDYFTEAKLLNIAHQIQQVTDWHKKMPAL
ncbi:Asp-tRNA(Asn)/Glu-tRNA(Gln) amidotransferase subunit GatA [Neisseria sp. Ec49-e6-T10]|uniref:Asp-tRNA(Asn)/Glu-tRNA(Gln) amidotransferase subunit GatA n=1 Tax=Neisseria sp. Ec49-e6-T10 TaxID=3140744 RepID=UPI003EC076CA